MAAATAGTGSRSLRAGGSSRGSLLARRLQLSPPGFQSVRPDVFPPGSRAPQPPSECPAPPADPRPLCPLRECPRQPGGRSRQGARSSARISGCPGSARWGGSGPSNFSFLQVTGSSNPAMISQDVPKHPRERLPFKPKLKTMRIITKDLIRDLM